MTTLEEVITPREKEKLFLQFLHAYLNFMIYLYKCSLTNDDREKVDLRQLENSLTNSLTLLWQMHVAISTFKTYYKKANNEHGTSIIFDQEQSELIVPQLRKMKFFIHSYPFKEKVNQQHCLSILEQIQLYYEQCEFVIVDTDLCADPWLTIHFNCCCNN